MLFKEWIMLETLRSLLKPVPQSPKWHSEGDVFVHTKMVRKQLNDAIEHFKQLTNNPNSPFSNLNPHLDEADINILRIGAWMHDVGKHSATTIEGKPWKENPHGDPFQIKSIGHENPEHFEPMMQQLGNIWKTMYDHASQQDKDDLWYIIKHHMNLTRSGFSKRLIKELVDQNGKFINERKVKLLLILTLMDKSGRLDISGDGGSHELPNVSNDMKLSAEKYYDQIRLKNKPPQIWNSPLEFARFLHSKRQKIDDIKSAVFKKFGTEVSDQEILEQPNEP